MNESGVQEAAGCGGGFQRSGEEPAGLSAADLAGVGERQHPC